jgi:hypothetical protein
MFNVIMQSEEVAYSTKTGDCLQTYTLRYENHSTKHGDEKKYLRKNFMQNERRYGENVQATKGKDKDRHKNGLNMPFKF